MVEQNDRTRVFFEKLCSLTNEAGGLLQRPPTAIQTPFIIWLQQVFQGYGKFDIIIGINKLEMLGYLSVNRTEDNEIVDIQIRTDNWDPEKVIFPEPAHRLPTGQKRFAVLIDYMNLEYGIKNPVERFRDFSWLFDPILEEGKIIFAFVFIPEQVSSRPPIMQLFHSHGFSPILCPRQIDGAITKDKDTVDARMIDLGKELIEHSDITHLVVVSGDADFQRLITFTLWRQKKVIIVSADQSLSRALAEMEGKNLSIRRI